MARLAVEDGITACACTPHITPGLYNNNGAAIRTAVAALSAKLLRKKTPLKLLTGADILVPGELISGLKPGRLPPLKGSRFFPREPTRHLPPPRFEQTVF